MTFNEADFPFRDHLKADPRPFSLFEEQAALELRHVASGESWGSHQHSLEKGTADAHGALGSVVGSRRVCGQGQSVGTILPAPLFEGGLSRQALSPNATGKRQRVRTSVPPPDLRSGLLGGTGPWVPAESSVATSLPTGGEAHRGPPWISGGVTVPHRNC